MTYFDSELVEQKQLFRPDPDIKKNTGSGYELFRTPDPGRLEIAILICREAEEREKEDASRLISFIANKRLPNKDKTFFLISSSTRKLLVNQEFWNRI